MPIFISLLRGINVGGNKKIKMADLKALYESLGFRGTQTLLQSGNAVFDTDLLDANEIAAKIEAGIKNSFGFESKIIMCTVDELKAIVEASPFTADQLKDPAKILVMFLPQLPDASKVTTFIEAYQGVEVIHYKGQELFIFYTEGIGRSKLDIDKKLKLNGTARNWNTINKLLALAETLEAP